MWDGFNKRKFPRIALRCEITILAGEEQVKPVLTLTENLGIGGVCVILDKALERFSVCSLRLDLAENQPPIECKGKVVWVVPTQSSTGSAKQFDIGIEFSGLDTETQARVQKFIELQVKKSPQSIIP